jgi:outer membrane protein assembly factor BamD
MTYRCEWPKRALMFGMAAALPPGVSGQGSGVSKRALMFVMTAALVVSLSSGLEASIFHKKKYENPVSKDTQQPDKVLFDKAVNDIEHGRFEIARITLNTLINTYDSSEFLAKAKLAIADSWYREGGTNGNAQAEAEYKDFILFYPQMQEAAEAQNRICLIHYNQMTKADRDDSQAVRAEFECKQVIEQFPNSKFVPQAKQTIRNIQEARGEHEFVVGDYYKHKGANPAAANRLDYLAGQFPYYSKTDLALFEAGEAYMQMDAKRFRQRAIDDLTKLVRDYPLSPKADQAKKYLTQLEAPIPEPNQEAVNRMKYDQANYKKTTMVAKGKTFLFGGPDVSRAEKGAEPPMEVIKPGIPVSVPVQLETASVSTGGAGGAANNDVQIQQVGNNGSKLDTAPDARAPLSAGTTTTGTPAAAGTGTTPQSGTATSETQPQQQGPLPTNHAKALKEAQKSREAAAKKAAKKNAKKTTNPTATTAQPASTGQGQPATTPAPAAATPAPATTPAPAATPGPPAQPTTPPQQ